MKSIMFSMLLICGITSYAVARQHIKSPVLSKSKQTPTMDLSKISNETVKHAIEALQTGDKGWYSYFTEQPEMTDDGNTVDFKTFFAKALGSEKFQTIDKVINNGQDVYGLFKAGNWGTFKVFFKFHFDAVGKCNRLEIGQAKY